MDEVNKMKPTQKSTNIEVERRVKKVAEMLLNGQTRSDIIRNTSDWRGSERQIDAFTARAQELVSEINREDFENALAVIKHNYWKQYRGALKDKDILLAVNVLDKLAKLMGLCN